MQWDRSNTIALATETCKYCEGNGTRVVYKTKNSPCNCVFRAIFRACMSRFRDCAASGTHFGTVSWEFCGGPGGRRQDRGALAGQHGAESVRRARGDGKFAIFQALAGPPAQQIHGGIVRDGE